MDIHSEYDLVQLIGEGWYSRVYLAEHRTTRDEVVLKAINSNLVTADEFCREYQSSINLWPHKNILKVTVVNGISRSRFFWRSHLLVPSPFLKCLNTNTPVHEDLFGQACQFLVEKLYM